MKNGFVTVNMSFDEFSVLTNFSITLIYKLKQVKVNGDYICHFYRNDILSDEDWNVLFSIFSNKKSSNKFSMSMKPQSLTNLYGVVRDIKKNFDNEVITVSVSPHGFNLIVDIHNPHELSNIEPFNL